MVGIAAAACPMDGVDGRHQPEAKRPGRVRAGADRAAIAAPRADGGVHDMTRRAAQDGRLARVETVARA